MAVWQLILYWQTRPLREQARSHSGFVGIENLMYTANPLWERACSR
ncbi:hypothetical protein DOCECA_04615 [Pseudomonas sp. E102]